MKRVAFHTLGCKLNYAETTTLMREFSAPEYTLVDFMDRPDIFVINTCSVTENADTKCHQLVRKAKAVSPHAYVAIVGCYAQLKPNKIAAIPGVNAVLGTHEKFKLMTLLDGFKMKNQPEVHASTIAQEEPFHASYSLHDRTRSFLKVQDGCDYSCSFCTIPLARGKSRSGTVTDIVRMAKVMAAQEVKEVVLTGVNIGDFGLQKQVRKERFLDLIMNLEKVEGIDRFRISSIEPNLITDDVINFVAQSRRFVPHFHIPLQSGSTKILRLMKRRYPRELYEHKVKKIKSLIPHCCIGADVIVGFPGEEENDFMETHTFLQQLNISYLHVFTYSERDHTAAAQLLQAVPLLTRSQRSKSLRFLSDKKKRAFYETYAGTAAHVLFENDIKEGKIHGFTDNYIRTAVPYQPHLVNTLQKVRLEHLDNGSIMQAALEMVPQ